ncbi:MAG: hypothetical protein ACO1O6_10805 [Bacteroidota bacterium]
MKKSRLAIPLVILSCAVLAFSSCRKEEPVPEDKTPVVPTPSDIPNAFFAEVDGEDYYETSFSGTKNDTMLLLSAPKGGGVSIGLIMPLSIGVGTYTFDGILGPKAGSYSSATGQNGQYMAGMGSGTLEIIFHDKNENVIRGAFSYTATPVPGSTATDSHNITNGTFTYNY